MAVVIGTDGTGRRWSIGELARASGLTVRALHHYDQIGVLPASERTAAGHRRYTERDLRRLYRIRALRTLGLSLEEIAGALADPVDDLAAMGELLTTQLHKLDVLATRIARLQHQIHGLLHRIEGSSMPDPDQFMTALEMMSVFDTYFTPEQREQLAGRAAELGPDAVDEAKVRWAELVEHLLRHVRAGTPVEDPQVQALLGQWDALGVPFHGGDEQVTAAAQRMWQDRSAELSRNLPWPADQLTDLVAYLHRARQQRVSGHG